VALVVVTGVAAASPPLQFRSHVDVVIPEPGLSAACGFTLVAHLEGTDHLAVWFDDSGAPTKIIETTPGFVHTFVNVATGATYTSNTPASLHITLQADGTILFAVDGLIGHILVGGEPASVNAGRNVWQAAFVGPGEIEPVGPPIFEAGPKSPPVPALCAALSYKHRKRGPQGGFLNPPGLA
jgi:hypothetical protein